MCDHKLMTRFFILFPTEKLMYTALIFFLKNFQIEDHHQGPIYHPSPNVSRHLNQMTEDEQIKIAQRLGLIQHLPLSSFDAIEKTKE